MAEQDSFNFYALRIDPQTNTVSAVSKLANGQGDAPLAGTRPAKTTPLDAELNALNELHQAILAIDNGAPVPPPPMPVNPKRTAQVQKLRDAGNAEFRKGKYSDAVKFYTLGLDMAIKRPSWEPAQMVLEDIVGLFANRAQALMAEQDWVGGASDAALSVEARRTGNAKAWWRRGKCLMELGRLAEAGEWVRSGLEMEGAEPDLQALRAEIETRLEAATASL